MRPRQAQAPAPLAPQAAAFGEDDVGVSGAAGAPAAAGAAGAVSSGLPPPPELVPFPAAACADRLIN